MPTDDSLLRKILRNGRQPFFDTKVANCYPSCKGQKGKEIISDQQVGDRQLYCAQVGPYIYQLEASDLFAMLGESHG